MSKQAERADILLLRVHEAAILLGISRAYAYELAGSGELPTVRLGVRAVRIPREALGEWVRSKTGRGVAA